MADVFTKKKRSWVMSRIRSTNTKPELILKGSLKKLGFSYQPKGVVGRPDFANKNAQIAVFVHGCFWHGCPRHYRPPVTNREFWLKKVEYNKTRDRDAAKKLKKKGWKVVVIWEHDALKAPQKSVGKLKKLVKASGLCTNPRSAQKVIFNLY